MKKSIIYYIILLVIGLILFILGCFEIVDSFFSGLGGGLCGVSIMKLLRLYKYSKDKEYKDKVELETHDERNIQMAHKAGDMTMRFSVFALCISEIFFFIFKMQTVGYVIGVIICAMCILYYGLYLYYKFKK